MDVNHKPTTIATLGSHSALQILKGAKDEGFPTLIVALPDRSLFYKRFKFIDEIITIDSYAKFPQVEKRLLQKNAIIIPHGSFITYLGVAGNKKLKVPYFGNKNVLDWEADRKKQQLWLKKADIKIPRKFKKGQQIDRTVIIKLFGAEGGKGYFVVHSQKEFDLKIKPYLDKKFIVQEYIIGVTMYPHYFYSPLTGQVELLSIDRRYETNVDSLGRLPLKHQESVDIEPSFVVVGNSPLVLRESLLPEAYAMAERLVKASKKLIDKQGLYGPFCLETIVTPDQKFYSIEVSCRIVAGTNLFIDSSPYSTFHHQQPLSTGRRIAKEIKTAISQNKLDLVLNK